MNEAERINLRAWIQDGEIILTGFPDEDHNCDEMGCNSIEHVLWRAKTHEVLKAEIERLNGLLVREQEYAFVMLWVQ